MASCIEIEMLSIEGKQVKRRRNCLETESAAGSFPRLSVRSDSVEMMLFKIYLVDLAMFLVLVLVLHLGHDGSNTNLFNTETNNEAMVIWLL